MRLDFIPLDKLSVSKANMRFAKRPPDVTDILPTVRARGVLQPVIVRPAANDDGIPDPYRFEIVAGARRYRAASLVAEERREAGEPVADMPCAILDAGDDAAAVEASLIENVARADAHEVQQWETYTRLVREGRSIEEVAITFGIGEPNVKRILALGGLLPRIRSLYAEDEIDPATIRVLTMASRSQQKNWLALLDDPDTYAPTGSRLKAWLFGGAAIPVGNALFDVDTSGLVVIGDLFGESNVFSDAEAFWQHQNAAIEERRQAYIDAGWGDVVVLGTETHFYGYDYDRTPKKKGGKVYIDVRASGEVEVHEGYISRSDARRAARVEVEADAPKRERPEITAAMQTYVDLHRHAVVQAELVKVPGVALRLLAAQLIVGTPLVSAKAQSRWAKDDGTRHSVTDSPAVAVFREHRAGLAPLVGIDPERGSLVGGNADPYGVVAIFLRLLDLTDTQVLDLLAIAAAETLFAGSAAVDAVGECLGIRMASYWHADDAFFDLVRDKAVLTAMVGEIAGPVTAEANAGEKGATLKRIIADHLEGTNDWSKIEGWVPKWLAFPPAAYTPRGGVTTVRASQLVAEAREALGEESARAAAASAVPDPDESHRLAA